MTVRSGWFLSLACVGLFVLLLGSLAPGATRSVAAVPAPTPSAARGADIAASAGVYLPLAQAAGSAAVTTDEPFPKTLELPVPPDPPAGESRPVAGEPCPAWVHAAYVALAPNGKLYPTWHPTTDPKYGCTFDHEHGMDPRTWTYFAEVGLPPFGYVNDVEGKRKEDHVGNKVFVIDDDNGCAVLSKVHQGTHSPDAFVNNLHELQHHIRCTDGRRIDAYLLAAFGASGSFTEGCINGITTLISQEQTVTTGTPTNNFTSGRRLLPGPDCQRLPDVQYEAWQTGLMITKKDGLPNLAYFDPIFAVFNGSRYYDTRKPNNLGRSLDRCRELPDGLYTSECVFGRNNPTVTWDGVQSPFKGDKREWYVGQKWIFNDTPHNLWYCDPYGQNAQSTPFPGSVPVYLSNTPNISFDGYRALNRTIVNDGPGVKSPN